MNQYPVICEDFQSQFSSDEEEKVDQRQQMKKNHKQSIVLAQQSAELQRIQMMNELFASQQTDTKGVLDARNQIEESFEPDQRILLNQKSQGELSISEEEYDLDQEQNAQIPMTMTTKKGQFKHQDKNELYNQSIISNNRSSEEFPKIRGWLEKRSPVFLMGWKKRYCTMEDGKFCYFTDETQTKLLGCLDFDIVSITVEITLKKKVFILKPIGLKKVFQFRTPDSDFEKWIDTITIWIKCSMGLMQPIHDICIQKRFWRSDRVSQKQFEKYADTGDIILFRGKNIASSVQRSFTRSEYDHVGLILRYSSGDLYLFESTGVTGVGLLRWDTFIKKNWHQLYEKLVFRHLEKERSDQMIQDFENFIKASKKYKVTATKLFKKNEEEKSHDTRTFFCSELVAAAYKRLGLLPQSISAAHYWPGAFAAEKNLQLMNAHLGREVLIDFSLPY